MAYDPVLAERIRDELASQPDIIERKMFGGLAFLLRGHMTAVASGQGGLMIRADPDQSEALVQSTPAEFAVMRGKQMKGWLRLDSAAIEDELELTAWIERSVDYASTLPPKR